MNKNKRFYIVFVVFVSNAGGMYSSGYVTGPLSEGEAVAELERLNNEPTADGGVQTKYYLLPEGEHECSVPSWQDVCRQCHEGGAL